MSRTSLRRQQTMQHLLEQPQTLSQTDLFAEKFNKITFRDFSNNTRMDIKNVEMRAKKIKRDRAINYWQKNVVKNFLPLIDVRKRNEILIRKEFNEPVAIQRMNSSIRNSSLNQRQRSSSNDMWQSDEVRLSILEQAN